MILSKMFVLAEAWGLVPAGGNPCRHVVRYKRRKRERFLTDEEYRPGLAGSWPRWKPRDGCRRPRRPHSAC